MLPVITTDGWLVEGNRACQIRYILDKSIWIFSVSLIMMCLEKKNQEMKALHINFREIWETGIKVAKSGWILMEQIYWAISE